MTQLDEMASAALAGATTKLELAIFGVDDPGEIGHVLTAYLAEHLAPCRRGIFYRRGTGIVIGVELDDGRQVVVKVHRRWAGLSIERLVATQRIMGDLRRQGLPAPEPLVAPSALREGLVTVESNEGGDGADGHRVEVRRSIAALLHRLIEGTLGHVGDADVASAVLFDSSLTELWPEPHDLRFDFDPADADATWIDEIGRTAQIDLGELDAPIVVGHVDWRVDNLGFRGDECVAIYDWDSLARAPEAVFVGAAAVSFCAGWQGSNALPTIDEARSFVADYERARGHAFSTDEQRLVDLAGRRQCAYGARCQRSDERRGLDQLPANSWSNLLRQFVDESLCD